MEDDGEEAFHAVGETFETEVASVIEDTLPSNVEAEFVLMLGISMECCWPEAKPAKGGKETDSLPCPCRVLLLD